MDLEILNKVLTNYNITYNEFLYLLLRSKCVDFNTLKESLLSKNIGHLNKLGNLCTKYKETVLINNIYTSYKQKIKQMKKEAILDPKYIEYAEEMQKLYPSGTRPGCSVKWRGNKLIIAKKLTTLSRDFGIEFTKEQAIDIVNRYVNSFGGDTTYMECLEYFILREKPIFKSNFLSYLEDSEENNQESDDFNNLK